MQEKRQSFNIKGIKRDISQGISTAEYAYDAYNIRITVRDNNTLMSVSNERGTEEVFNELKGYLLGYVTINNKVIFFMTVEGYTKPDYIYLIDLQNSAKKTILYNGNLNFKVTNPIESIGIFENEEIQRIYWVDGINQPRVINIATKEEDRKTWKNHTFDFISLIDAGIKKLPYVSINKLPNGNGCFPAGIVQYAFTFYNKYGSESNIFYQSELFYATTNGRGVSPDGNSNCAFNIKISNIPKENTFDYIRIYSILRSSYDATPTVKVVNSLSIKNLEATNFIDSNLIGYNIEPTNLLYLGGQSIIAGTIAQKDNTLFLGNIESISKNPDSDLKINLKSTFNSFSNFWDYKNLSPVAMTQDQSYYPYGTRINSPSSEVRTFKGGEYYRLGLQFQRHDGTWTEAVFLGDKQCDKYCKKGTNNSGNPYFQGIQGVFTTTINNTNDYIAVRPLVVYPDISNRAVLAQGVLNPTVFNLKDRMDNSPYAQASWFFRPISPIINSTLNPDSTEFRMNYPIPDNDRKNAEIQNINSIIPSETLTDVQKTLEEWTNFRSYQYSKEENWETLNKGSYYVDQNIITLNSPDIEFDDNILNANFSNYKVRYIGIIPITGNSGNVELQADNGTLMVDKDSNIITGFYNEKYGFPSLNLSTNGSLLAKPMWMDKSYLDKDKIVGDETTYKKGFIVYPWHRNGSLNDTIYVAKDETKRAVLKHKVWLNYKYSEFNYNLLSNINTTTIDIGVFHSDEVSMEKLKTYSTIKSDCIYYGNINKVLSSYDRYPIVYTDECLKETGIIQLNFNGYPNYNSFIRVENPSNTKFGILRLFKDNKLFKSIYPFITRAGSAYYTISKLDCTACQATIETVSEGVINFYLHSSGDLHSSYIKIGYYKAGNDTALIDNDKYDRSPIQNTKLFHSYHYAYNIDKKNWASDLISMKYKSTPHAIISLNGIKNGTGFYKNTLDILPALKGTNQCNLNNVSLPWCTQNTISFPCAELNTTLFNETPVCESYLWMAEIYRDVTNPFGSTNEADIANNVWQVAGEPEIIDSKGKFTITWNQGDAFYQRYDCIKTYPFTTQDQNSVLEVLSFMVETRINLDARYDRNRGDYNNLNITPLNYNLLNPVYNQTKGFFTYRSTDSKQIKLTKFPTQVIWSKTKILGEEIDTWTNITLASSINLDGDKGKLNSIKNFNNQLYAFQDLGISNILYNDNVQIAPTQGVPIEIANSGKVQGKRYLSTVLGCVNKWSIMESSLGLYFIDTNTGGLYIINPQITPISDNKGFKQWFNTHNSPEVWNPKTQQVFRLFYDTSNNDLYVTNNETCLVYSEYLQEFTSFMSYEGVQGMFNLNEDFYSFKNNNLYRNFKGQYNTFYGVKKPFYITYIANGQSPMEDKIFNSIEYKADFYNFEDELIALESFDRVDVWHDYQTANLICGEKLVGQNPMKKKFNIWRVILPRCNRQRIRNPWTYIRIGKFNPVDYRMQLHQLDAVYYV